MASDGECKRGKRCRDGWIPLRGDKYRRWTKRLEPRWHHLLDGLATLECGGGGNCLFHVIAKVATDTLKNGTSYDQMDIRKWLQAILTPAFLTDAVVRDMWQFYASGIDVHTLMSQITSGQQYIDMEGVFVSQTDALKAQKRKRSQSGKDELNVKGYHSVDGKYVSDDDWDNSIPFGFGEPERRVFVSSDVRQEMSIQDPTLMVVTSLLDFFAQGDREELSRELQAYALNPEWQGDEWILKQLALHAPLLRNNHIVFVSIGLDNDNDKKHERPILAWRIPNVPDNQNLRYILLFNQDRGHWQLIGQKREDGAYRILFMPNKLPDLVLKAMNNARGEWVDVDDIDMFGVAIYYPKRESFDKGAPLQTHQLQLTYNHKTYRFNGSALKFFLAAIRARNVVERLLRGDDDVKSLTITKNHAELRELVDNKEKQREIDDYYINRYTSNKYTQQFLMAVKDLLTSPSHSSTGAGLMFLLTQLHFFNVSTRMAIERKENQAIWGKNYEPDFVQPVGASDKTRETLTELLGKLPNIRDWIQFACSATNTVAPEHKIRP